ncbi:MAG: TonB-dependent receptor [Flavobacteriales bacterium]|nr:TonB-dependent receptor [Flavobacteriales bacterium]
MKNIFLFLIITLVSFTIYSQNSLVKGKVTNSLNNQPIPFAKIIAIDQQKGAISDENGMYEITGLNPGIYSFKATVAGFKELVLNEVTVTNARSIELNFALEEIILEQEEVVVKASPFQRKSESPVSLKTLNATEIERLPGAGRDVSKVIAALPGVASRATFRNDIIIRGGSPGENKFYLDGIEVPNINHFATQGSSGGPVGLLNVNFIREVDFYSGAFPANRANGLSSVLSFKQKDGNQDAFITNFALGSSDAALTFDGPIGKKVDFIFSARRSYLQFLFAALQLPILPTYNDFQYKFNFKVNDKNKITFIGLGAIDDFRLNAKVNDKVTDSATRESNNYILNNLPLQKQWNYTVGINWLHYSKNSYQNIIISRNMLNNSATRTSNKIPAPNNVILDYSSFEAENKFRFEHTYNKNGWRLNTGVGYEYAKYFNSTFNRVTIQGAPVLIDFESTLGLHKVAMFGQLSKSLLKEKLNISLGLRTDVNSYAKSMMNPLDQLSPSFSVNYRFNSQWALNGNIARYHQLPAYTILGYRDANGVLKNKENDLRYISADHFVLGTEYLTKFDSRFTLEGFFKSYNRYPFSLKDSLSLANIGSDFGVVGNEEVKSISTGRTYGVEFLYQQKMYKGFYAILAYTYVVSEFKDKNNSYVPTSWDSRNIVSLTGGKRFKKGWEVGFRWLFSGGSPYTPIDVATSSLIQNWDINGQGLLDINRLNTQRESNFHQLNLRVDKKIFLDKFNMNFYLDIQNVYGYKAKLAPQLLVETDANDNPIVDPNDPTRYKTKFIENTNGIVQPTIGIILEFAVKKGNKVAGK